MLSEWDYEKNDIVPSEVTAHSAKRVWWKCDKGHSYLARVSNRVDLRRGCPVCSNKIIVPGINDLATTNPDLLYEWDYSKNTIKPTELSSGTSKKIWWKCSKCGFEWIISPNTRTTKKSGCPQCADSRKGVSFKKCVQQISVDGVVVNTYASVKEAAKAVNRSSSAIVNVCKGKTRTCAGYHWKYK